MMNSTARTEVDSPEGSDIRCAPVCPPDKLSADSLHTPLEEAIAELYRRRCDKALCRAVAEFQQSHPPEFLDGEANAFFVRPVFSADLEVERFSALSRKAGLTPLCLEVSKDRFYSFNREKYRRGKLAFRWPNRTRALRVIDFQCNGQRFDEIPSLNGCSLVEFHHRLLAHAHPKLADRVREASDWIFAASQIPPRYLHLLSLAITDGILFENFFLDDPEERRFMEERILPSFHRITELFGVKPLIVRLFSPEEENTPVCWEYPGELYPFARNLLNGGRRKHNREGEAPVEPTFFMKGESAPYPILLIELRSSHVLAGEIGVFTVRRLKKGDLLAPAHRYDDARFISWPEHGHLDAATRKALRKFCTSSVEGCHAPENLNFIHPLWYCNHSCDPNVAYDAEGNLHALRAISKDAELCFDYSTIERFPPPRSRAKKCKCGSSKCKGWVDFL